MRNNKDLLETGVRFAAACDMIPALLLSESCKVISATESFRSCCGKAVDRTLLLSLMSSTQLAALEELCADPYSASRAFDISFGKYRFAIAYRPPLGHSACGVLFLLKNESQRAFLADLLSGRISLESCRLWQNMPVEGGSALSHALSALFSPMDELDGEETAVLLSRLASRLCRGGELISSEVTCRSTLISQSPVGGVPAGYLSVCFATLLSFLDSVSASGSIDVSVILTDTSVDVRLSSRIAESADVPRHTDDLLSLSALVPSCSPYLTLAAYSVIDSGLSVSADRTDEALTLTVTYRSDNPPVLEFKFRDSERTISDSVSAVITVIEAIAAISQSAEQEA